jgi:hypothetical protein
MSASWRRPASEYNAHVGPLMFDAIIISLIVAGFVLAIGYAIFLDSLFAPPAGKGGAT